MKMRELISELISMPLGQTINIHTTRILDLKKKAPIAQLLKMSSYDTRMVEYDNKKDVIEARAKGILPSCNAGLNGMEWVVYPRIVRSIKNPTKLYMVCHSLDQPTKRPVSYSYMDGMCCSKCDVEEFMYSKDRKVNTSNIFYVGLDTITMIDSKTV